MKALTERNGFAGYPVVTEDNELVGIITGRDVRFVTDLNQPVSVYMTPKERLVTVREGEAREVVLAKMHEKRVEKALVVDDNFHLLGMITVKDFQKAERKPNSCKDEQGRLRVGAAVGAGAGNEERVDALVAAGVDVLLIDSSHGHSEGVLQRIRETRAKYPDLQIIGGNVRHWRRRSRTGGSRLQRGESGYRPWLYLYDSYRDWRGRSADHRCFRRGRSAGRHRDSGYR